MEPHDLGAYEDGEDHSYQPLSWRTDPATSLSDWDVVVTWEADGGGEETRTYHVHKQTLAVGPRSGAYWAKLFARWADGTAASELRLDGAAAACVPALLDYQYDPRGALDVSTATAMPLLHLASYLGMRSLYDALVAFVQRDLRPETAAAYVAAADRFGLDRCRAAAVKVCASHMEHAPSLEELPPDLFLLVARSEDRCCAGAAFSRRVASSVHLRAGRQPCVYELDPEGEEVVRTDVTREACLWASGIDVVDSRLRAVHWRAANETTLFRGQHVRLPGGGEPYLVSPLGSHVAPPGEAPAPPA